MLIRTRIPTLVQQGASGKYVQDGDNVIDIIRKIPEEVVTIRDPESGNAVIVDLGELCKCVKILVP